MLRAFSSLLLIACFFTADAQWVRQQNPFHKKDFTTIASKKYTMSFEYEITDDVKTLTSVVEYGNLGLPATLYTKGTNDNGDSINTSETIYKFDKLGREIRKSFKDMVEGENYDVVYSYQKNGNLAKKNSIHLDPTTTVYTYDAKNKITKAYSTVRMPAVDKNGESTGKAADFPNERKTFAYDKAGRLIEETTYNLRDGEGGKQWSYKTKWFYNDKSQLIKLQFVRSGDYLYRTETYEYNAEGLLEKRTEQSDDEAVKTFVYEYCTSCKQSWMN